MTYLSGVAFGGELGRDPFSKESEKMSLSPEYLSLRSIPKIVELKTIVVEAKGKKGAKIIVNGLMGIAPSSKISKRRSSVQRRKSTIQLPMSQRDPREKEIDPREKEIFDQADLLSEIMDGNGSGLSIIENSIDADSPITQVKPISPHEIPDTEHDTEAPSTYDKGLMDDETSCYIHERLQTISESLKSGKVQISVTLTLDIPSLNHLFLMHSLEHRVIQLAKMLRVAFEVCSVANIYSSQISQRIARAKTEEEKDRLRRKYRVKTLPLGEDHVLRPLAKIIRDVNVIDHYAIIARAKTEEEKDRLRRKYRVKTLPLGEDHVLRPLAKIIRDVNVIDHYAMYTHIPMSSLSTKSLLRSSPGLSFSQYVDILGRELCERLVTTYLISNFRVILFLEVVPSLDSRDISTQRQRAQSHLERDKAMTEERARAELRMISHLSNSPSFPFFLAYIITHFLLLFSPKHIKHSSHVNLFRTPSSMGPLSSTISPLASLPPSHGPCIHTTHTLFTANLLVHKDRSDPRGEVAADECVRDACGQACGVIRIVETPEQGEEREESQGTKKERGGKKKT
ncbi:hypothetical protein ADUPG1_010420 [Aduncisulcus paluster]|uniref:Uncharacterized protein n=1 Tax=Aduncisulcus paluster TaxID=2918883 RepID=A0ABQ5JSN0_9EUKA|nr:hypothetical protein ADUPG1_010420 [Aduncisulcus paluster]